MAFYEFKKWFFDISEGMNDYLILFVSQIKLGEKYYTSLQVHGSKRESQLTVQTWAAYHKTLHQKGNDKQMMSFDEGEIRFENGNCKIHLDFDDCRINLEYTGNTIDWPGNSTLLSHKSRTLNWIPLILYGLANGSVSVNGESKIYRNAPGYSDEVRSTFIPWKVPISQIYWGRLHHELINLSYSVLQNPATRLYVSMLFLDINGEHYVLSGLQIDILHRKTGSRMDLDYPDHYILRGHSENLSISIEVNNHQEMILSDFMDYEEEYGVLATRLLRWISRDPKGIKFYAPANMNVKIGEKKFSFENIWLVDEYVEFR